MMKKVFITGGTSGIGLEVAKMYQNEGHIVGTCSFENPEDVIGNLPKPMKYYQADVTNTEEMKKAIDTFAEDVGGIDICIANAGISMKKAKIPDFERGRRVINTNVIGVLNTFEPAIEVMKKKWWRTISGPRIYLRNEWNSRNGHLRSF
jgi:meso-butanediol dehydrogenase/(S,S)-butanediol dehydrogenase/diacetyl reductase